MYALATTNLSVFNFMPGQLPNSNQALKGHLDCPKRLGKTFHNWPNRHGVQPYVAASEINLGGRDIVLFGYILAGSDAECKALLKSLYTLIDSFTDLVPLTTPYGIFNVYVSAPIVAEYISDEGVKITFTFREPRPDLSGVIPVSDDAEFGIDYISFKSLGGFLVEINGDVRNRPAPKAQQVTAYIREGYQVTKREARELNIRLFIEQPDYPSFEAKIRSLYKLLTAPGIRSLNVSNDTVRSFFVTDGFEVHTLFDQAGSFAGVVEFNAIEDGTIPGTFADLVDKLGNKITDIFKRKIIVRI